MRKWSIIFFITTTIAFAQNEANIWYFGYYAGLDFNSGSPVALDDGQLRTDEGCASISDSYGNLLFYTDGSTVYDSSHNIMQNGTGLFGGASSTNSAIIVPKPGNSNIYYIFTVKDQRGIEGLSFSEVDMTLNNGMGAITSLKNQILYSPVSEKLTAIKHSNGFDSWVVSHKWSSNEFIAYHVSSLGVNNVPVESSIGNYHGDENDMVQGAMKISPDGTKLATATRKVGVELFDFDNASGKVSNARVLITPDIQLEYYYFYGIEFSSNSRYLYANEQETGVYQFDTKAGDTNDIINSKTTLANYDNNYRYNFGSMQLAFNGKIYVARVNSFYLDVINSPNQMGVASGYQENAIFLNNQRSIYGLPPFIQSFFNLSSLNFENICFGDLTKFLLNDTVDSVVWDFGDPASGVNNTSTDFEPTHVFTSPGSYEVSVTATIGTETATETATVTINELPIIASVVELKQCDNDLDGFSPFNLDEAISKITANASNETITFFETQTDAENNTNPISNLSTYTNQTASLDTVWARVENINGCYKTSQVDLIVTTTQIPNTFMREFYVCDDDTDGISQFDFSSVQSEIESIFPLGQQLIITYYRNEADALAEENPISDITNYSNVGYPNFQQIYVRVDGQLDNDCLGLGAHINLYAEPQPVANQVTLDRQCDDDQDGMFPFDVSLVEPTVLGGQSLADVTVTYLDENNNMLPSPLPNPFLTGSQVITIRVLNNNVGDGSCFDETSLELIVDNQPIAHPVDNQIVCDDGEDDTDGLHDFDTSLIESTILNGQTGMEVHYYDESGTELKSPLPNPFTSSSQTITVNVVNPINDGCYATTSFEFIVNPLPEFTIETPRIVCSSDPIFSVVLDPQESNVNEVFNYEWFFEDGTVLSNQPTLTVSTSGTYSVTLTKTDGTGCSRTRDVFVNASELATITQNDISVTDNSNNNTITININSLGQGDYEFALDDEFLNYQDQPFFNNVTSGIHTIYIRDKKGCGTSSIDVSLIGYPKYFTPNGDGINDFWQIKGVNDQFQTNSDIFIYDRYGKLLKQLATTSNGWDGTMNGRLLPNDDYWFRVYLQDGRVMNGHFTLKR